MFLFWTIDANVHLRYVAAGAASFAVNPNVAGQLVSAKENPTVSFSGGPIPVMEFMCANTFFDVGGSTMFMHHGAGTRCDYNCADRRRICAKLG